LPPLVVAVGSRRASLIVRCRPPLLAVVLDFVRVRVAVVVVIVAHRGARDGLRFRKGSAAATRTFRLAPAAEYALDEGRTSPGPRITREDQTLSAREELVKIRTWSVLARITTECEAMQRTSLLEAGPLADAINDTLALQWILVAGLTPIRRLYLPAALLASLEISRPVASKPGHLHGLHSCTQVSYDTKNLVAAHWLSSGETHVLPTVANLTATVSAHSEPNPVQVASALPSTCSEFGSVDKGRATATPSLSE